MNIRTVTLIALAIQFATIISVYVWIKEQRTRYLGFLFLCILVGFHGITEIFQVVFPGINHFRDLTNEQALDRWIVWVTVAIVIYAAVYCTVLQRKKLVDLRNGPLVMVRAFDWRINLPLGILLKLFPFFTAMDSAANYWLVAMVIYLSGFPLLMGIVDLILSKPSSWQIPIMIVYVVFLSLFDTRLLVLTSFISMVWLLSRLGHAPRIWKLLLITGLCGCLVITISQSRVMFGREALRSNILMTISTMARGAENTFDMNKSSKGILEDFVYRFDGNAISSVYMNEIDSGVVPAGFGPILTGLYLCIPSAVMPSKLESDVRWRLDKEYLTQHYGMSSEIDYVVGLFGVFYGCYGLASLLLGSVFMAVLYAWLDNKLMLVGSVTHTLLFSCFLQSALMYEQNVDVYMLNLRSAFIMVVVYWVVGRFFNMFGGQQARHKQRSHKLDPRSLAELYPNQEGTVLPKT